MRISTHDATITIASLPYQDFSLQCEAFIYGDLDAVVLSCIRAAQKEVHTMKTITTDTHMSHNNYA